jgi:hypothetical protein
VGSPLWDGTAHDEMRGCYDSESHMLHHCPIGSPGEGRDARPSMVAGRTSREMMAGEDDEDTSRPAKPRTQEGGRSRSQAS